MEALTWSAGVTLDIDSRKLFDMMLRELVKFHNTSIHMPESYSVYEVYFNIKTNSFMPFRIDELKFDGYYYHEIMVPTMESTQIIYAV